MNRTVWIFLLLLLAGCGREPQFFEKGSFPSRLSEWGVLQVEGRELVLHSSVTAYDLNTPLFTDYAHKLRTIWTPGGSKGAINEQGEFDLPTGAIISKTFYYPTKAGELTHEPESERHYTEKGLDLDKVYLIETRLLVHLEDGWHGLPYIWNKEQTEARLEITGAVLPISVAGLGDFNYVVPDSNQCQGCHETDLTAKNMGPIGLAARHVDKPYGYLNKTDDQLAQLASRHNLELADIDGVANARWADEDDDLEHRARSYLDINCGHCHNPHGAADTSGMFLNIAENDLIRLGHCKPPIAAGQGTGGHLYGISPGNAAQSILTFRMQSKDPGAMMPELGRSLVHREGVELISAWINQMPDRCN